MLKSNRFDRATENEIQRFLEECESFSQEEALRSDVLVFYQTDAYSSHGTTISRSGEEPCRVIFPFQSMLRIEYRGHFFSVNAIDNRSSKRFDK